MWDKTLTLICPLTCGESTKHVDHNWGEDLSNIQGGSSDTMLKSNGPKSISKNALRDEDCSWLINCTTQEYLVNVGQNSHFNSIYSPS